MIHSVSHLIDDATPGGVNRLLDFLAACPELAAFSRHTKVPVRRGQFAAPKVEADIIVSNLVVSWANLPLFVALRAAYPNTPLAHIEHSYSERFVAMHVEKHDRFETLLRTVYSLFDHLIAVSDQQARWLDRKGVAPPGRLTVIEPLADIAPLLAIPERVPGPKRIIGAIGRMDPQKGFDILIEAFRIANAPDLELHLYGQGAQEEELRALAGGAPNIVFQGFAPNPVVAIAACDIIAMPSRWEPYGMVAIEAMAGGKPLICSRVDGLATHIAGGAIDVGENSVEGWVARLRRIDELDLRLASARGRNHAESRRAQFVKAWSGLIETALPKARRVTSAA